MKAPIYLRLAFAILSLVAFLAGLFLALGALVFFGKFNFANNAHLGIFAANVLAPVFVAIAGGCFQVRPSGISIAFTLFSYAMTVLAFSLWSLPAARGLIH